MCLKIEIWFPGNNLRTTRPKTMKFNVLTDLIERTVPIDFWHDQMVGGAFVLKKEIWYPQSNLRMTRH